MYTDVQGGHVQPLVVGRLLAVAEVDDGVKVRNIYIRHLPFAAADYVHNVDHNTRCSWY